MGPTLFSFSTFTSGPWFILFSTMQIINNNTKMAVFWVVAPCTLAMIALMIEAARASETLVNFDQTTRRYNPEDSHLRAHRRENLKSY
jgi:hypothetical protein